LRFYFRQPGGSSRLRFRPSFRDHWIHCAVRYSETWAGGGGQRGLPNMTARRSPRRGALPRRFVLAAARSAPGGAHRSRRDAGRGAEADDAKFVRRRASSRRL